MNTVSVTNHPLVLREIRRGARRKVMVDLILDMRHYLNADRIRLCSSVRTTGEEMEVISPYGHWEKQVLLYETTSRKAMEEVAYVLLEVFKGQLEDGVFVLPVEKGRDWYYLNLWVG